MNNKNFFLIYVEIKGQSKTRDVREKFFNREGNELDPSSVHAEAAVAGLQHVSSRK